MLTRPITVSRTLGSRTMATATTAAQSKEILPLKGVKVLDMTRVLAGVSTLLISLFSALAGLEVLVLGKDKVGFEVRVAQVDVRRDRREEKRKSVHWRERYKGW